MSTTTNVDISNTDGCCCRCLHCCKSLPHQITFGWTVALSNTQLPQNALRWTGFCLQHLVLRELASNALHVMLRVAVMAAGTTRHISSQFDKNVTILKNLAEDLTIAVTALDRAPPGDVRSGEDDFFHLATSLEMTFAVSIPNIIL